MQRTIEDMHLSQVLVVPGLATTLYSCHSGFECDSIETHLNDQCALVLPSGSEVPFANGTGPAGRRTVSNRYQTSATAVRRVTDVPTVLPSLIFDFVPGTPPSWSWKVYVLHGHTPYAKNVTFSVLLLENRIITRPLTGPFTLCILVVSTRPGHQYIAPGTANAPRTR